MLECVQTQFACVQTVAVHHSSCLTHSHSQQYWLWNTCQFQRNVHLGNDGCEWVLRFLLHTPPQRPPGRRYFKSPWEVMCLERLWYFLIYKSYYITIAKKIYFCKFLNLFLFLCVCVFVYHECVGTHRDQKEMLNLTKLDLLAAVSRWTGRLVTKLRSSEEQAVFLAKEPSLWPLVWWSGCKWPQIGS